MKSIYTKIALVSLLLLGLSGSATAREFVGGSRPHVPASPKANNAMCKRAQSTAELNVNNVRALINGYGNMWYDGSVAQYHIPKNGNTCPLFCAALWIGGTDVNDQLRIAALRFGSDGDDYWPGPLKIDNTATVDLEVCNRYDRHYVITKAEVLALKAHFEYPDSNVVNRISDPSADITDVIKNWPARGEGDQLSSFLAPFYDADGDGEYHPENGDYPYYDFDNALCPRTLKANLAPGQPYVTQPTLEDIAGIVKGGILSDQVLKGDQTIWWVFNDMGNVHTETGGQPIGLEIRAQAFAFSTNDEINNMSFYSYEIINRSTYTLANTYFSQWVDPDLGDAKDDYVGCDVRRGLGYCYNGDETDGPGAGSYSGIPPAVGIDFFQGPYMDPDGKDNPKINISWIKANGSDQMKELLRRYEITAPDGSVYYDTIAITDDADMFDFNCWYFVPGDAIGNCAINGVNFGNNIIDDERFGMRRFVYYNNTSSGNNAEPDKASDYYNYLKGQWRNGQRMKYGGNALTGDIECDFMFPGDSDPWHWGTDGIVPTEHADDWTEVTAGNTPSDRRFMQSAGPFTLKPGALNYITVGIPFAQASSGNAWSSVELLRQIDDVCQSLFENCFKVLDGPDAPTMTAQELNNEIILYLHYDNPESNNYGESYMEIDPSIVKSYSVTTTKDTLLNVRDANGNIVPMTVPVSTSTLYPYTDEQRSFKFEGYQIYQLVDANASVADIGDISKARLVAQCDIENYYDSITVSDNGDTTVNSNPSRPIGTLVNFTSNSATGLLTGEVMVQGANKGIQHVFRVTDDMFATGVNTKLVNNKEYYYVAIAYAYNCFKEYSQTDAAFIDGQMEPYLAGRKNERGASITPITVIPHNPELEYGGMVAQSEFGMCPNIIRIEGYGNGGSVLRLTEGSLTELMGAPGEAAKAPGVFNGTTITSPCIIANPSYEENYGPLNVRVIDPMKVREGEYNILFWNKKNQSGHNVNDSTLGVTESTRWCIVKANGEKIPVTGDMGEIEYVDTVWSDFTVSRYNEQLFLELGLAITLVNPDAPATDPNPDHYNASEVRFFGGFVQKGALLGSEMLFANENTPWLSGLPDNDNAMTTNWIRSGSQFATNAYIPFYSGNTPYSMYENHLDEDYFKTIRYGANDMAVSEALDKSQEFEGIVGGLWSPYALVSTMPYHPGMNFSYYLPEQRIIDSLKSKNAIRYNMYQLQRRMMTNVFNKSINFSDMSQLPSVRIVFTADTTKWTRCPVIEMCDDYTQSENNARKFSVRHHASVDKLGRTCEDLGIAPDANDPSNPAYIDEQGMGWFPGYAINVTTGERLNIMFGEDSRFIQYNGRDMLWNPVSTMMDGTQNYVLGGRHFIYVMNATNQPFYNITNENSNGVTYFRTPSYDAGRWARKMLSSTERLMKQRVFSSGQYQLFDGLIADEGGTLNIPVRDSLAMLYASVAWVNIPLVSPRYSFTYPGHDETLNSDCASNGIPCDVTINIDIRNPYGLNMSPNQTTVQQAGNAPINVNMPAYQFRITSSDAVIQNLATAESARQSYIDSILSLINVVPNPYYSYSKYETASQLETKVRIINLPTGVNSNGDPEGCIIRIYTMDGTLVRTLGPTAVTRDVSPYSQAENTSVDWDLHNHTGIPIAGGMYLIHVSVPGIGERVIKWFGTMRPVDLNSFSF